jgi:hypothetical protein
LAELPAQTGLDFAITFNLQNLDELHLNVGRYFWVEWFPCWKREIFEDFVQAVIGLVSGEYRIVETYIFRRASSARLERPNGRGGWRRTQTWALPEAVIPWRRKQVILQNRSSHALSRSPRTAL